MAADDQSRQRQHRRPKPLVLDRDDSDEGHCQLPRRREIPVRRTFIEYGVVQSPTLPTPMHVSTAPAWIGPSFRAAFDRVTGEVLCMPVTSPRSAPNTGRVHDSNSPRAGLEDCCKHEGVAIAVCSSWKVEQMLPDVMYRLSPTSAKAAGYTDCGTPSDAQRSTRTPSPKPTPSPSLTPTPSRPATPTQWLAAECAEDASPRIDKYSEDASPNAEAEALDTNSNSDDDSDSDSGDEGLCPQYSEHAELPSKGSAAHGQGMCKRCCFFPKGRCNNGFDCHFCHFAHEKRKPKNKKKKRRRKKRSTEPSTANAAGGLAGQENLLQPFVIGAPMLMQVLMPAQVVHQEVITAPFGPMMQMAQGPLMARGQAKAWSYASY
eukprot:gnl/TRDRNA2_/TRDRNA2_39878_c0_seq1.p1 gnl/TRDRNA2_/TRDRNA2_39878_c0~~gnl/TRDRNA2_/TRDRNA2_39878_c0_seq1.p1  ORF type:complete len:376 (-),score=71.25 gnl/TRDRNA2_/TRDRNA2_39878_c0_seq1:213-1340(-)